MAGDSELRRRLRVMGHPVGDHGSAADYYRRINGDALWARRQMAGDSINDHLSFERLFPTVAETWRRNERGGSFFAVPVGERRNARDDGRGGMAMDSGARRAYRNDAASAADIERMWGRDFAKRFASIGVQR